MNLTNIITDNIIFIIPYNIKRKLINYINSLGGIYNIKIYTYEEIKKHLLFDYDEQAIYYIMKKYEYSFNNAKEIIENLYFLFDSDYKNPRLQHLFLIKKELLDNNLLYTDFYITNFLNGKKIFIYGFTYLNKYQHRLFTELEKMAEVCYLNYDGGNYSPLIKEFVSVNDEIEYVANDIIEKNLDLNIVYIANLSRDYLSTVKRVFGFYQIPINIDSEYSLYDTKIGVSLLNNLDNILAFLNTIDEPEIYNKIITIINKYSWADSLSDVSECIANDLQHTKLGDSNFITAVSIVDIVDNTFDDDEFVYLIGFNEEYIPHKHLDDDYISDIYKPDYIDTTLDKNLHEKISCQQAIRQVKHLTLTYASQAMGKNLHVSSIIDNLELTIEKIDYKPSYYSKKSNIFNLAILLDDYLKYSKSNDNLGIILNTYPNNSYLTYDNSFSGIKNISNNINLSYTKLNCYYECAFHYYLDNVLKLLSYEQTFEAYLGSLCHDILSKMFDKDFDLELIKNNYMTNNPFEFTIDNKFFLNKIIKELEAIISHLKSHYQVTKFKKIEMEKNIKMQLRDNVLFSGIIDKIMKHDNNLVLIDYKTGTPNIDLKLTSFGLNLQLPLYLFLIKSVYPESNIVGIYLQHVLSPLINKDFKKTLLEQKEQAFKLAGFSTSNESILSSFDPTYEKSEFIKGMSLTSKGFSTHAKVLSDKQFDELIGLAEAKLNECIDNILNNNFPINPKRKFSENISCNFCKYKAICYVNEKDYTDLYPDGDLSFLGGDNND